MTGRADAVFAALADPTRRSLLELLVRDGAATATALARRLPITRQAIGKHLSTLEDAGLVRWQRVGREVRFEPTPHAMNSAAEWMNELAREWDARLARLAAVAEAAAVRATRDARP